MAICFRVANMVRRFMSLARPTVRERRTQTDIFFSQAAMKSQEALVELMRLVFRAGQTNGRLPRVSYSLDDIERTLSQILFVRLGRGSGMIPRRERNLKQNLLRLLDGLLQYLRYTAHIEIKLGDGGGGSGGGGGGGGGGGHGKPGASRQLLKGGVLKQRK